MKISPNLYGRMDGSKFWYFPWFPENSLVCVILRYTVYVLQIAFVCLRTVTNNWSNVLNFYIDLYMDDLLQTYMAKFWGYGHFLMRKIGNEVYATQ